MDKAKATTRPPARAARQAVPRANRRPPGTAMDGRSREFRLAERTRADLVASLGGNPSPVQSLLIEECVSIRVRLWQCNALLESGQASTDAQSKTYIALTNSFTRVLHRLGVNTAARAKPAVRSLAEIVAADRARADAAP